MNRALVYGFDHPFIYPAVLALRDKEIISIAEWIGRTDICPHCTKEYFSFTTFSIEKKNYLGYGEETYATVYNYLPTFIDMMSRNFRYYNNTYHDFVHMFNMLYDYWNGIIIEKQVNLMLFPDPPHDGPGYLLYQIAKSLNIKTVILRQTLFPNKLFPLLDINDIGIFSDVSAKDFSRDSAPSERQSGPLREEIAKVISHNYNSNFARRKRVLNRIRSLKVAMKDGVTSYLAYGYLKFLKRVSFHSHKQQGIKKPELAIDYVYFPLHLQPEMTTSTLGGMYVDQILAIERLSTLIPKGWFIYVKENPAQTDFMRSNLFYERMSLLSNVRMVSAEVSTYELMNHCRFVATITGTAGWEAVTQGKNVLIFGQAWYRSLPGVFSYHPNLQIDKILDYRFDNNSLKQAIDALLGKTRKGIIDPNCVVLYDQFDPDENVQSLAKVLEEFISLDNSSNVEQ